MHQRQSYSPIPVGSPSVFLSVSSGQSCWHDHHCKAGTQHLRGAKDGKLCWPYSWRCCLVPVVEAVGGSVHCCWRFLGRRVSWLWEGAAGTCLGSCWAWWRQTGCCNQDLGMHRWGSSLATERIAWVCSSGEARMQHAELGAAVLVRVARNGGTSSPAPAWKMWGQCLCWIFAGLWKPVGKIWELWSWRSWDRSGLPPEDGEAVSRQATWVGRPAVSTVGMILGLVPVWFRFKSQWTGLWFLFRGYNMAMAFWAYCSLPSVNF